MKILILTEFFPKTDKGEITGGVETRAFYIAKELAKEHEVTVITSRFKDTSKFDNFGNINVIRCGVKRSYSQTGSILQRLSYIISAYLIGKKLDIDIIDGYNYISYIPAIWISKKKKIPAIATYHDVWINGDWIKNVGFISGIIGEIIERYILSSKGKKWRLFITNSNATKNKLVDFGVSQNKIYTIYSGIILDMYNKIIVEKYNDLTIVCLARLVKYKKIDNLINAINIVKNEIPNIKCKILGDGPERKSLELLVKRLNLENNVEFMGFVNHSDGAVILKSSHVFCLPSIVEGMGLVTVEAMAAQVPYVNSDIPPTVEITNNGKGGLLFKKEDYKDLANKIIILLKNKKIYNEKFLEAKEQVKIFDWSNITKNIEEIYILATK